MAVMGEATLVESLFKGGAKNKRSLPPP